MLYLLLLLLNCIYAHVEEVLITNNRYSNEDVLWGRPKGLVYGNLPGASTEQKANLYPDQYAIYFVINVKIEKTWTLMIKGEYPHSRYMSYTIAKQLGNGQVGNGLFLRGDQIIPDEGSYNPFIWNSTRDNHNRNYTIYLKSRDILHKEPNTLYFNPNERVHLSLRIYLVDRDYDGTGVVKLQDNNSSGLPLITLLFSNGSMIEGPSLLQILDSRKNGDPNGYTLRGWLDLIESSKDKVNAPCLKEPFSELFWNTDYNVPGAFYALQPLYRVVNYPPNNNGGFASNPDTKYMIISASFSYNNVLVITGKKPSHPYTKNGERTLPTRTQVQYFSITTGAAPPSGEGWSTVYDEDIPVDDRGYFTLVVSWPWNRPEKALHKNNITWLSPGNGEGNYVGARNWVVLVYIRYENCDPLWKESPMNIPMPTVQEPIPRDSIVMREYYPVSVYMSSQDFDSTY